MIEIIGKKLDLAFQEIGINAIKTYEQEKKDSYQLYNYQVWEMDKDNFDKLSKVDNEKWEEKWGWLVFEGYDYEGELYEYIVNGNKMLGYIPDIYEVVEDEFEDEEDKELTLNWHKYIEASSFSDWMEEVLNLTKADTIAAFAISLAKENNMKLSEFMRRYQP